MVDKLETLTKRITIVTPSLSCGGAERAVVLVAEGLVQNDHIVSIVTISEKDKDFYQLSNKINRLALNVASKSPTPFHAIWNNFYRIWKLRKTLQSLQPDVVISFLDSTNILTLLSLIYTKYPVLVSEQNNPATETQSLWSKLRRFTYPMASKVVSCSEGVDNYFDWLPKSKRGVIYNPVQSVPNEPFEVNVPIGADKNKKWAIAMGRLTRQKGFDLLLASFRQIADNHPDWQLLIFGEGELRGELEKMRDDFGLNNQVIFPGLTSDPIAMFKSSKLFVLSSRWEGLGVVILEALACGLPVVSMDCPSGPREVIRNEIDGLLVPNEDITSFALAMDRLMSNDEDRQKLASRTLEAVERFSIDKIVKEWEFIIRESIARKSK